MYFYLASSMYFYIACSMYFYLACSMYFYLASSMYIYLACSMYFYLACSMYLCKWRRGWNNVPPFFSSWHKKLNYFLNVIPCSGFFGRLWRRWYCQYGPMAIFLQHCRRGSIQVTTYYSTKKKEKMGVTTLFHPRLQLQIISALFRIIKNT